VQLSLGSAPTSGTDALGAWQADTFAGSAGGVQVEAAIRRYSARGAVTFDITLPHGATATQRAPFNISLYGHPGHVPPMLDFPAFSWGGASAAELGVFTIGGDQIGQAHLSWGDGKCGQPPRECAQPSNLGRSAGPALLFEDPRKVAVAICPLTHSHTATNFFHFESPALQKWQWGPSGELSSLPKGFTHRTLVVLGPHGFTDAWERMGAALQAMSPLASAARLKAQAADLNLNQLSYYTDAGTVFTNGDTLGEADLVKTIASADLPFGMVQLDDWSHATNDSHPVDCGCLENWTGNPQQFPRGWLDFAQCGALLLLSRWVTCLG
jgi:hypothetical protein